uniref:Uncharacterized protein n=1 Tax=Arundo donax TaxID=35708 RepID=A0A0A9FRM1_ARUDO
MYKLVFLMHTSLCSSFVFMYLPKIP